MPIKNKNPVIKAQMLNSIVKSVDETALFPFFSTERMRLWLDSLNTMNQVLSYGFKIILLFAFIFNAGLELARLITAKNRNFERWFAMFIATSTAITGGTAIIGLLTWGATFALFGISGPWLFMIALGAGVVHQTVGLLSNLYKALMAPKNSQTRRGYLQAAALNILNVLGLALTVAMIVTVMISPAGPAIAFGVTIAAAAVAFVTAAWLTVSWIKPRWTERFKKFVGFYKPQDEDLIKNINEAKEVPQPLDEQAEGLIMLPTTHEDKPAKSFIKYSLFKREYHKETVYQSLRDDVSGVGAITHLQTAIFNKIGKLVAHTREIKKAVIINHIDHATVMTYKDEVLATTKPNKLTKNLQKVFALLELYELLNQHTKYPTKDGYSRSLAHIINKYPKIHQSFFSDISDTQDLFDAAGLYLKSSANGVAATKSHYSDVEIEDVPLEDDPLNLEPLPFSNY